jgi:hypothetical protein
MKGRFVVSACRAGAAITPVDRPPA